MFEHRYNTYIRLTYFVAYITSMGAFLLSMYLSREDILLESFRGIISISAGAVTSAVTIFLSIAVVHALFIIYLYSLKNKIGSSRPKDQVINFSIIALGDMLATYCLQCFLPTKIIFPEFYIRFYFFSTIFISLVVYGTYAIVKIIYTNSRNKRNFIMVGSSERSVNFSKFFENNNVFGFHNIGYLDDENFSCGKIKIIGKIKEVEDILRNNIVDIIVVSLPVRTYYDSIVNIINISEIHGIPVYYMTDIFNPKHSDILQSTIEGSASITMYTAPLEGWKLFVKRIFDIIFSLILIAILSPLLIFSALIIKIKDKGSIFYSQDRVGYNKRIFKMHKFRTMCDDADTRQNNLAHLNIMDGPVFKIKNDPRITPVGRILRKFSIDELPQLFNVLLGDMSIVGPRPMALRDYKGFPEDWQRRRFSMRPGLTCYWQIQGRNNVDFETWMRLDMEYIDNWSLWEDFRIILLTIPAVLKGDGL